MASWATGSPNAITGRRVPLRFRLHTAMAGVPGLGGDLTRWTLDELAETARYVAAYKAVRRTVQHGHLHRLTEPGGPGPRAVQYVGGDGAVLFEWRPAPDSRPAPPVRLRGLLFGARYRVTDDALPVTAPPALFSGSARMSHGLPPTLPPGPSSSRTVTLRKE
ncbi:alpha-galactosidase [Kitasatospora cineracea]|uniref:alpha-galactosidase n=1 Tax=Kitasatospora cineracea TaxID=88074 RepID=UPI002447E9FF|nr:alpha-galactosidase [Kitasatospora cineracea]